MKNCYLDAIRSSINIKWFTWSKISILPASVCKNIYNMLKLTASSMTICLLFVTSCILPDYDFQMTSIQRPMRGCSDTLYETINASLIWILNFDILCAFFKALMVIFYVLHICTVISANCPICWCNFGESDQWDWCSWFC